MNIISELFIKQKIEFKFVLFSIGQTLYAPFTFKKKKRNLPSPKMVSFSQLSAVKKE